MSAAWEDIAGAAGSPLLLVADHASNRVPAGIDLGIPEALLREHVAVDIGVAPLARSICETLCCPGMLGGVSRLVIDCNREEDAPGLIPESSDGHLIPGNAGLSSNGREERLVAYFNPYHDRIAELIAENKPKMLISLHSFTPQLSSVDAARPWQIGVLYNLDDRAARIALALLAVESVIAGDNLPYSGKVLNATMNRHGEANGIPYLGIEVRQDLIADEWGVASWSARLERLITGVAARLDG